MAGQLKGVALRYYNGTVFGDVESYLKVTRMPLSLVRDGVVSSRSEVETRAFLGKLAERNKQSKLTDEERGRITGNMLALIEDATIEFIGASTASLTFMVKPPEKEGDGPRLLTLILHRKDGVWRVIQEISDSTPVPAEYLKE